MTKITPTAAAKAWRVGKSTIYKAMNSGELSFETDESQKRVIDPSEMIRVYGEPGKARDSKKDDSETNERIADLKDALLRQERNQGDYISSLKDQIEAQQKQIESMANAVDRITRLLEHQQQAKPEPPQQAELKEVPTIQPQQPEPLQQPAKRKKSLFGRLLSAAIED